MIPAALAALHAACFTVPPPWTEADFADLLAQPGVHLFNLPDAFALGRIVADEAELLTLAVAATARREGRGRILVRRLLDHAAATGAARCFLEVADDNGAALSLYRACGFHEVGRRRGYYRPPGRPTRDAVIMACELSIPRPST